MLKLILVVKSNLVLTIHYCILQQYLLMYKTLSILMFTLFFLSHTVNSANT